MLKIADFGLATIMTPGKLEMQRCGSPGYVAPEVLNGKGYDTKADIFSAGVILYILLSGMSPFQSSSFRDVLVKNRKGIIEYPENEWGNVSTEAIDLVKKMTEINPAKRISAAEALVHKWFSVSGEKSKILSSAIENMKKYHGTGQENRFNVERIKPEFSSTIVNAKTDAQKKSNTITNALLNRERRNNNNEMIRAGITLYSQVSGMNNNIHNRFVIRPNPVKPVANYIETSVKKFACTIYPTGKAEPPPPVNPIKEAPRIENIEEEADFKEEDMDERPTAVNSTDKLVMNQTLKVNNNTTKISTFYPGSPNPQMLPPTPGPGIYKTMKSINYMNTPDRKKNNYPEGKPENVYKNQYLTSLTHNSANVSQIRQASIQKLQQKVENEEHKKPLVIQQNPPAKMPIDSSPLAQPKFKAKSPIISPIMSSVMPKRINRPLAYPNKPKIVANYGVGSLAAMQKQNLPH